MNAYGVCASRPRNPVSPAKKPCELIGRWGLQAQKPCESLCRLRLRAQKPYALIKLLGLQAQTLP